MLEFCGLSSSISQHHLFWLSLIMFLGRMVSCPMPDLVVLPELSIDCDLRLFSAVEPFSIKHFSSKRSVEAFDMSVFP